MTSFLVRAVTAGMASVTTTPLVAATVARGAVTGLAAVAGLLFGSFLNVVVYRVPRHLSVVEPRSFCPHCDTPLRAFDNVPLVSWVVLGGRCRTCRAPISVRYPLVELTTGVVFAALGWGLGPHWAVAGFCVLAATLVALVTIEGDRLAPPLSVAVIGTGIASALLVAAGVADRRWHHVVGVVVGVAVAGLLVALTRRRRAGEDDRSPLMVAAPVLLPVGAALGWLGPVYVGEGLAATVVVFVAASAMQRTHRSSKPDPGRVVVGFALAAGVGVALVIAVAVGAGAGT